MAYSEKTYPSDGVTTDFAVTFDYLDQSHIRVSVDKVLTTTVGSDYKFTWNNSTNIRVDTVIDGNPVPAGLEIRLIRETPIATPAVVFGGAASLSSENLNKNSEYLTFALQEATDANEEFTKLYLGAFASSPTVDNEGEALQTGAVYYDSVLSALYYWTGTSWIIGESTVAAEIFKIAAEAARDAAVVAKDAAVLAKDDAEAAASNAAVDAAAAVSAALAAAQGSADDASNSASAASTSASNAATSETNAGDSAAAAAASAASIDTVKLAGIEVGAQVNRDIATQAEAEVGTDNTKLMTPLRTNEAITDKLNATGTAPLYACRAWVNFNGTGVVAIRASGNVSSITDNGTGQYTVNFTTAMPDTDYSVQTGGSRDADGSRYGVIGAAPVSTTAVYIQTEDISNNSVDYPQVHAAIFR